MATHQQAANQDVKRAGRRLVLRKMITAESSMAQSVAKTSLSGSTDARLAQSVCSRHPYMLRTSGLVVTVWACCGRC